jgi:hypothetical protein
MRLKPVAPDKREEILSTIIAGLTKITSSRIAIARKRCAPSAPTMH